MEGMILVHTDRYDQLIQKELVADMFLDMLRDSARKDESLYISSTVVPTIVKVLGRV